jgi:hypothetical protein
MASNPSIACPEYSRALRSRATDLVGHKHVDHTDQHYVACLKAMHKGLDSVGWDRYSPIRSCRYAVAMFPLPYKNVLRYRTR